MTHRVAAAIVIYHPDPEVIVSLIYGIAPDVQLIQLFLNSALPTAFINSCITAAGFTAVRILGNGRNVGLGRAYNEAARHARESGCDLLLLLDQDSTFAPGMAARLTSLLDRARGGASKGIIAIGPRPTRPESGIAYKLPPIAPNSLRLPSHSTETCFIISSGSIISIDAMMAVGRFREDFFIDCIDIEWWFRARALGFSCIMALNEYMPHRLGRGLIRVPFLNITLIDQPPERLYTYARNQIAMMRLRHVPSGWKLRAILALALRILITVPVYRRSIETKALLRGIIAGLRSEIGAPPPLSAVTDSPTRTTEGRCRSAMRADS